MRVVIVGAGAVGGLLAGLLAQNGHDVAVTRPIGALRVETPRGTLEHTPEVVDHARNADVVVVAVKAPALPSVAALLAGTDAPVVSAQNGLPWWLFARVDGPAAGLALPEADPGGRLAEIVPVERIVGAVLYLTASVVAPGHVRAGPAGRVFLGRPGGGMDGVVTQLGRAVTAHGYTGVPTPEIEREIWTKVWANAVFNPVSALTGRDTGAIFGDPACRALVEAAMDEVAAVGRRVGLDVGMTAAEGIARAASQGPFRTSMLQDVERGRVPETEALLGTVRRVARHVGEPTPRLDALYALMRLRA